MLGLMCRWKARASASLTRRASCERGEGTSEPEALIAWFAGQAVPMVRIGLEAGPLSQWLFAGMEEAGLPVELLETRHVRAAFKTMPVKTDRKDARGIAQLMRLGWFRPVHCKSLPAQEVRALLTARKLLQAKRHDVEMSLRGVLRGFGLKVGPTTPKTFEGRVRIWWSGTRRYEIAERCCWHARCSSRSSRPSRSASRVARAAHARARAADDRAGRGRADGAHLRGGDRRSRPVPLVQDGRAHFGLTPRSISPARRM